MVSSVFLVVLALAMLLLPLQWIFAATVAMTVHELCHYWMVLLCGGVVRRVSFGIHGARMEVEGLSLWKEVLCALAGPVGGLMLVFAYCIAPRVALCGCFQSVFNLLPVYPLDGGRILHCIIMAFGKGIAAGRFCLWIEKMVLVLLLVLGFYGCFILHLGMIPLIGAFVMILRAKRPCKVLSVPLQ